MNKRQLQTPVAFLIFNRPDTTAQVFAAIRAAQPETLLIVADGPRSDRPTEHLKCNEVRAIVEQIDWPCNVLRNYSEANLGCKRRVSTGLDWVFSMVEEAIILEDDCLPDPSFFQFCEEVLKYYRDDKRIMMIGGTNYLLDELDIQESYFFSRYYPIWGWATWRRAWQLYDIDMKAWPRLKEQASLNALIPQKFIRRMLSTLFDSAWREGGVNTWDIQWCYTCLLNNGLCAVPKVNLISNIGVDGTHTSGNTTFNCFPVFTLATENIIHPDLVYPYYRYDNEFFKRYQKVSRIMKVSHALKLLRKLFGFLK